MDLSTRYLGMELKHPIIASASPMTSTLDRIRALEDAGAAAVVGDKIVVRTVQGTFTYKVSAEPFTVRPTAAEVLQPIPDRDRPPAHP